MCGWSGWWWWWCDNDADGGGGNSKDHENEDGISENWCVDGEGGDETEDEQTESVAGGLAKCSGSSETEMTVGEIWWGILKETQW